MMARSCAVIVVVSGCTSPAEKKSREATTSRAAVSAESAKAAVAAALPLTGKWDEPHLVERLVQSGLAPQAAPAEKSPRYWGVGVRAWRLGAATLHAYLYPDSSSRRRATAALDSLTIAPPGTASPYPLPRLLIVQNNLAAVLVGGNERQQERVSLALTAGLPSPPQR